MMIFAKYDIYEPDNMVFIQILNKIRYSFCTKSTLYMPDDEDMSVNCSFIHTKQQPIC
jgi:hypothetical protein